MSSIISRCKKCGRFSKYTKCKSCLNIINKLKVLKCKPIMRVEIVKGVEGNSIYFNNWRAVGSKPWGGGSHISKHIITPSNAETLIEKLQEFVKDYKKWEKENES